MSILNGHGYEYQMFAENLHYEIGNHRPLQDTYCSGLFIFFDPTAHQLN